MTDLRPLREAELSGVEAVFTDVDGTLTTGSRVTSSTLAAVERLQLSVGVANVRRVLGALARRPRFVTRSAEGAGFEEVARVVLRQRRHR